MNGNPPSPTEGANDDVAESPDSAKQMPRAVLSGDMRCTTKHRRFLTLGPSHPIARGRAGFGLLAM